MQVKLRDPLRTCAIPERLRGVFTTRRYTNSRLPYLTLPCSSTLAFQTSYAQRHVAHSSKRPSRGGPCNSHLRHSAVLRCRAVECQQLYNRVSDSAASQFPGCRVVYHFRADSCCFIGESLASRHVARVYEFNSRGVTDDS